MTYKGSFSDAWTSTVQASSVGITMGRNLSEHLSVEGTAGIVPSTSRLSYDSQGSLANREVAPGAAFMGAVRYAAFTTSTGRQALTLSGGYYVVVSGAYGLVLFTHSDAGYEVRAKSFTLLVSYGLNLVNNNSDQLPSACGAATPCLVGFHPGDLLPHLRVGLGTTF